MNDPAITQFLIDITRGHLKEAYANDAATVLSASDLGQEARRAIADTDIAALWLMRVSPMALLYFSRLSGWAMDDYYSCITQAALKTDDQAHSVRSAQTVQPQTNQ